MAAEPALTTLFAAFGGGLLGAVAQPVLAHWLGTLQARDQQRRTDRRDARRYVECQVLDSDVQFEFFQRSQYTLEGEPSLEEKLKALTDSRQAVRVNLPIRPILLNDPPLEQDLELLRSAIWDLMYDAHSFLRTGPRDERLGPEQRRQRITTYSEVRTRILQRLDRLGW